LRTEKLLAFKVREANQLGDATLNLDMIMNEVSNCRVSKRSLRSNLSQLNAKRVGMGSFNTR